MKSIKHIAQSATNYENENSLERTFEGYLDINNICVNVSPKLNVFNAYASPLTRELFIEPKLILEAENDAQVSSVLAHELAHITMSHADELLNDFNLDKAEVIRLEKSCKKISSSLIKFSNLPKPAKIIELNEYKELKNFWKNSLLANLKICFLSQACQLESLNVETLSFLLLTFQN